MENDFFVHKKNVFSIANFWENEICNELIERAEATCIFPKQETSIVQNSLQENIDSRNSFKIYIENEELANAIYFQIEEYLNLIDSENFYPYAIHQCFRIYKYLPGQEFKKHTDGAFVISEDNLSKYSLLIYLNDNFSGGETIFDGLKIKPSTGDALVFPHNLEHAGSVVIDGYKYVLRGNIMFKSMK